MLLTIIFALTACVAIILLVDLIIRKHSMYRATAIISGKPESDRIFPLAMALYSIYAVSRVGVRHIPKGPMDPYAVDCVYFGKYTIQIFGYPIINGHGNLVIEPFRIRISNGGLQDVYESSSYKEFSPEYLELRTALLKQIMALTKLPVSGVDFEAVSIIDSPEFKEVMDHLKATSASLNKLSSKM